jgi:hypothetical protein
MTVIGWLKDSDGLQATLFLLIRELQSNRTTFGGFWSLDEWSEPGRRGGWLAGEQYMGRNGPMLGQVPRNPRRRR